MNFFVCLVRTSGEPITAADRRTVTEHLASRGIDLEAGWRKAGSLNALMQRPGECGPRMERMGSLVGVGDVRLDNPEEIADRLPEEPAPSTHLELALRAPEGRSADWAAALLGDFAYVSWDPATRRLVAARDAFGVKPLFYSRLATDLLAFSSHASLLAIDGQLSEEYIAKTFVRSVSEEDTIFESVDVFPAAHTLTVTDGGWCLRPYWYPEAFDIDRRISAPDAAEEFRTLFSEAVRLRLTGRGPVWCELSGGLDTSSVVSTSSWLQKSGAVGRGLSGTITYADSLGSGDESDFVNAVVQTTGIRNEQVLDSWPWKSDDSGPMHTEVPSPSTMFWSRDRQRDEILRTAGAEVLLSGLGGDHLLEGNYDFFADRLAAGSIRHTCGEMAHWAALQQKSFWKFAFRHGLEPLLPVAVRSRLASRRGNLKIPDWVADGFRRRSNMDAHLRRTSVPRLQEGALPRYRADNVEHIRFLARSLPRPHPSASYERRYPFLYRPLVELTLHLPPELKVQPYARKIVLREAMRGVLPERVRTRLGKGGIGARMLWALNHEHRLIEGLLRDPMLAQMGCVDARRLRRAYEATRTGKQRLTVPLFITLALETWLLIQSGRWPRLEAAHRSNPLTTKKERSTHEGSNNSTLQPSLPEAGAH